nr:hypothetical protein [Tanacetum cinerariifolium]
MLDFPCGNCIHCVGVGTNVEEQFDLAHLLNVAAKTLRNGKFGSSYKDGLIGNEYVKSRQNQRKKDKTRHENGKSARN